jgi:hypothetical protein
MKKNATLTVTGLPDDFPWYDVPKAGGGGNIPNDFTITKCPLHIPHGRKVIRMNRIYNNIFHTIVLQNIPKLVFLV